jgi:hypothetical protein
MTRRIVMVKLCLATVCALSATFASNAVAVNPNYFWLEEGKRITTNTNIELKIVPTTTFTIRIALGGGTTTEVQCTHLLAKSGGVIFNGQSLDLLEVGRDEIQLLLRNCKATAPNATCTVAEPIAILLTANSQSTIVTDKSTAQATTKIYDDFLPNSPDAANKEFTTITLETGTCSTPVVYKITTSLTRRGFGTENEGQAGLLGEVDKGKTEAEMSKQSHEITFICQGTMQEPRKAFNADAREIKVDEPLVGTNEACLQGNAVLKLTSGKTFSLF